MNHIYRSIWNATLGCWVAAPETARTAGAGCVNERISCGQPTQRRNVRLQQLTVALAAVWGLWGAVPVALAACTSFSPGAVSTCSGVMENVSSAMNNMSVTVAPGAQIYGLGTSLTLTGNNTTFVNQGTVDPSLLSSAPSLSTAVLIGNANNSILSINNSGVIRGTSGTQGPVLLGLGGMAIQAQNGAGGTTTITNSGTIGAKPLIGGNVFEPDIPVISVQGGSQVSFKNSFGGDITGRIAFQGTAQGTSSPEGVYGNSFINAGTLTGSLSLGANGLINRFVAVTGSQVNQGAGLGQSLPVIGFSLVNFAATGKIDGGFGKSNILVLQNSETGTGAGTNGSGTISSSTYVNFGTLAVNSGTWTLSGPVLDTSVSNAVYLNGGKVNLDNAQGFGNARIVSGGGALEAGVADLNLGNNVTLGLGGLSVMGNNNLTLSGAVDGQGSLTKTGSGRLTLSGANSYTGGTTIQAGTLALGAGGSLSATSALNLSGAGSTFDMSSGGNQTLGVLLGAAGSNLVLGANTLTFGSASSTTFAGDIIGTSGGLIKNGSGTTTVGGNSSYSGTTTVNSGTLVFAGSTGHQLGSGMTVNSGAALGIKATTSVQGAVTLANNSTLSLDATGATAPSLTAGSLGIANGVQFNLAGIGSYTADHVLISTSSGITGDFSTVNIGGYSGGVDYLTLVTQKSQDGKQYVATHEMAWGAKNNLAHGAFTLSQAIDQFSVSAALTDQAANNTWNGSTLTKAGAGTLVLSGNNTYTGGTQVNAGTLVAAHNQALGTGDVTVGASGTLAVNSGVALQVGGNLGLTVGSTYRVFVDPDAKTSGSVNVIGTAMLTGAQLDIQASNDLSTNQTYTILTGGTVLGQFASVTSNYAYLDPQLDYSNSHQVNMSLKRKPGSGGGSLGFADLSNTSNQTAAANALAGLPSTHALFQHIETLPAGTPAAVFNSLSGDAHSTVMGSVNMLSAQAPNISQQHLRSNMTAGFRPGAPIAQSDGLLPASAFPSSKALPAWVEVVGHWQKMDGNSNAPGVKQNTTGLFLGADEEVGNSGWRVGGSVGYTSADAKVSSRDASADISSYSAAVYTGKGFSHAGNRINVIGGLAYTKHSIESERSVATLNQNLKADYSAHTAQLFAEVGYAMGQYDKQGFEPFVGITLGEQRTNSFKESGGFAALSSESSRDTLASTTLGVRAHSDFVVAGKDTRVRASLGMRHAWGNLSQNRTMAFEGSSSFTVAGAPLARNTALVGLQAEMALSRYSALVLGYNGEYGSGSRDQSASVKVRWAF